MEQLRITECITCAVCEYGRDLGANAYGCRNEERRQNGEKLVNKADYNCKYAK